MGPNSILLVSNYYPPEQGAAPNRVHVLAEALSKKGYDVHIVCPMPNYPTGTVFTGFRGKLYLKRKEANCTVHRLWLWPSKSKNKFVRLLSMLTFSKSLSIFFFLKRVPKKVFVQYSPVFVGFTAVFWSWVFRKKVILNVSDLWPLAGLEMGLMQKGLYYSLLEKMEVFCYKKAALLLGQSEEILTHVSKHKITAPIVLYRNFPNFEVSDPLAHTPNQPIKIVYAGLLGVAQGLSEILEYITIPKQIEFHIYGDGPDLERIERLQNLQIIFHGSVSRGMLHKELVHYDIAFVPLAKRIYGSVPSKIFEYARLGLPLLYMAGGEGGTIVSEHNLGWVVAVQDYKAFSTFLKHLNFQKLQNFPKQSVQQRAVEAFDFKKQFETILLKIESL